MKSFCFSSIRLNACATLLFCALLGMVFASCSEDEEGEEYVEPDETEQKGEYYTYEEGEVSAVMTKDSLYAVFMPVEERGDYVFQTGNLTDTLCDGLLIDSVGFVKGLFIDDETYCVFYAPDELWLFDSEGRLVGEVPYSVFSDLYAEGGREVGGAGRATALTRNPIYESLCFVNTVGGFLEKPVKAGIMKLIELWADEYMPKMDPNLENVIDLALDAKNPLAWIQFIDRQIEISYFGGATLTSLGMEKWDFNQYTLACKIEGLSQETDFFKNASAYGKEILDFSYTLEMNVKSMNLLSPDEMSKRQAVDSDGEYSFMFDFKNINTLYEWEPGLRLKATVKSESGDYDGAMIYVPGNPMEVSVSIYETENTLYGEKKFLMTDNVTCRIDEVVNVRATGADVVCTFSDMPSEAECVVSISKENEEGELVFSGVPDRAGQTVRISELMPSTDYVASSYIIYKGETFNGLNEVPFTTPGVTGTIVSVEDVGENTAVVNCQFSNVESWMECGIIVKDEDENTKRITVPSGDGEQSVYVSGLEPGTDYICYVYITFSHSSDVYYDQGNGVMFTTKTLGIAGTWKCVETYNYRPYPGAGWEERTRMYYLTLNEDGSVEIFGDNLDYEYIGGNWSYSMDGKLNATGHIIATQTANTWDRFTGTVDDVKNPQMITGSRYRGNANQVSNVENYEGSIVMTR